MMVDIGRPFRASFDPAMMLTSLFSTLVFALFVAARPGLVVQVKGIHSHNDYLQDVPLQTALSYGAGSVEVDIWAKDNFLYVGHSLLELKKERTMDSLYIQPLLQLLNNRTDETSFSLILLVDMKTSGSSTIAPVLAALAPLREAGYLTTVVDGALVPSFVTVVGTGNTPLAEVQKLNPRDLFYDAPLGTLTSDDAFQPDLSPLASADYSSSVGWNGKGAISSSQLSKLKQLVSDAHVRGIQTRFWNTPTFPVADRNSVWKLLLDNGADWLNVDDLKAASEF